MNKLVINMTATKTWYPKQLEELPIICCFWKQSSLVHSQMWRILLLGFFILAPVRWNSLINGIGDAAEVFVNQQITLSWVKQKIFLLTKLEFRIILTNWKSWKTRLNQCKCKLLYCALMEDGKQLGKEQSRTKEVKTVQNHYLRVNPWCFCAAFS